MFNALLWNKDSFFRSAHKILIKTKYKKLNISKVDKLLNIFLLQCNKTSN